MARLRALASLFGDMALPTGIYYVLRAAGVEPGASLGAGVAVAALRVGWTMVRSRRVSWFAVLMLISFAVSVALTVLGGDPRFLLLKESVSTVAGGTVAIFSVVFGCPLTLTIAQALAPAEAGTLRQGFDTDAELRRYYRKGTLVWGGGLIVESLLRIPLIYALPLDIAAAASSMLMLVALAVLLGWTVLHRIRARRVVGTSPPARLDTAEVHNGRT